MHAKEFAEKDRLIRILVILSLWTTTYAIRTNTSFYRSLRRSSSSAHCAVGPVVGYILSDEDERPEHVQRLQVPAAPLRREAIERQERLFDTDTLGLKLRAGDREIWTPVPVRPSVVTKWLLGMEAVPYKVGFKITGGARFGLPAMPLEVMNRYWKRACCGEADADLPALDIEPVAFEPRQPLLPAVSFSELAVGNAAAAKLAEALKVQGWAKIRVDEAQQRLVEPGYQSLLQLLKVQNKSSRRAAKVHFDGHRFAGYGADGGRRYMQMRSGMNNRSAFPWPLEVGEDYKPLVSAFEEIHQVARTVFKAILPHLGLSNCDADKLLHDRHHLYGSTVMRALLSRKPKEDDDDGFGLHRDASNLHADLGLLTVAPPANVPSLELWNPRTGEAVQPEKDAAPGEWIVFAGQTLAFLTGGAVQAAAHHVPFVPEHDGVTRTSMPLFLRAAPGAIIASPDGLDRMTIEAFMENVVGAGSPWMHDRTDY